MPQGITMGGIEVDVLATVPLVTVTGQVDDTDGRTLSNVLRGLLAIGHNDVAVDLSGVASLDPGVARVFADVTSRGLVLHLRDLSPAAQELLQHEAS